MVSSQQGEGRHSWRSTLARLPWLGLPCSNDTFCYGASIPLVAAGSSSVGGSWPRPLARLLRRGLSRGNGIFCGDTFHNGASTPLVATGRYSGGRSWQRPLARLPRLGLSSGNGMSSRDPASTPVAAGRCVARRSWPGVLLCLPLLGLTGCSGTPFGDNLARSFSAPSPRPAVPASGGTVAPSPSSPPSGSAAASGPAGSASPGSGTGSGRSAASQNATGGAPTTPPRIPTVPAPNAAPPAGTPSRPTALGSTDGEARGTRPGGEVAPSRPQRQAPYRVTILLPQADAAAPAEVVTQALRSAGVPFEVETIERIPAGSTPARASASQSAPPPR